MRVALPMLLWPWSLKPGGLGRDAPYPVPQRRRSSYRKSGVLSKVDQIEAPATSCAAPPEATWRRASSPLAEEPARHLAALRDGERAATGASSREDKC